MLIKMYLFEVYRILPWIILSVGVSILVAYLYLAYAPTVYATKTSILLQDNERSEILPFGMNGKQSSNIYGGGFISSNLSDEVAVLKSSGIVEEAVDSLDYEVAYYTSKPILWILPSTIRETHSRNAPVWVEIRYAHPQIFGGRFRISPIDDDSFKLSVESDEVYVGNFVEGRKIEYTNYIKGFSYSEIHRYGAQIEAPHFSFSIHKNHVTEDDSYFQILDEKSLTEAYKNQLSIVQERGYEQVISMSVKGSVLERDIEFLNNLVRVYVVSKLDEKLEYYDNSISFIDEQLLSLTDSLKNVEDDLELFRKKGRLMDLSSVSSTLLSSLTELEKEKSSLELEKKYYDRLESYIKQNLDKEILVPSLVGISESNLESMLEDYLTLNQEVKRKKLTVIEGESDFKLEEEIRLNVLRKGLIEYVKNLKESNQLVINDIDQRLGKMEAQFDLLPAKDRALLKIQRKFELNDNIYTMLLSKRMELGISKAGVGSDIQLLEPAKMSGVISVGAFKIYLFASIIGLFLPIGIVIVYGLLDDKISTLDEVKSITTIPVLGSVVESKRKEKVVVPLEPKGPVAEMFRGIRMNMSFMLPKNDHHIIAITSYISGEGKTFCAMNLACTLALTGKKVLLVGADLRKPKIASDFNLENREGLTNVLIGNRSLAEVINPSGYDGLDILLSGPEPPNPVELIETSTMDTILDELKNEYSYIIIDTAPLGLVSDYHALKEKVDLGIFVVRDSYSRKKSLEIVEEMHGMGKLNSIGLIYNGVKTKVGYGYGYGYGSYGGDNYGYYNK